MLTATPVEPAAITSVRTARQKRVSSRHSL